MNKLDLGPIGVSVNVSADGTHLDEAAELQRLGYRTLWLAGGQIDTLDRVAELVRGTTDVRIGSAILSPDVYESDQVARLYADLQTTAPDRFLVGLGGSQKQHSLAGLSDYLDRLDQAVPPVPVERRLLAALGPRKLDIARRRAAGAIALLVTPAYTRHARTSLGVRAVLVIDQFVVMETDPVRARGTARGHLEFLSRVAGYRANFARMGFTEEDISTLSDHLVDELVAWGDASTIAERVRAHKDAGADHVILAVLNESDQPGPLVVARELAGRLSRIRDARG